jgi:hypothetical protein
VKQEATDAKRQDRIAKLLKPHTFDAFKPSTQDVAKAAEKMGVAFPEDYIWFTTKFGSTEWPIQIVDALDTQPLTDVMKKSKAKTTKKVACFAREPKGTFAAFDVKGKIVFIGQSEIWESANGASFLDYLEAWLEKAKKDAEKEKAAVASDEDSDDDEFDEDELGGDLDDEIPVIDIDAFLKYLIRAKAIETTRGFNAAAVAEAYEQENQGSLDGEIFSEWLINRDDIVEVFASEEEMDEHIIAFRNKR